MNARDTLRSCLASNNAWRREANLIRQLTCRPHLLEASRDSLMREAVAADALADAWLHGAMDLSVQPWSDDP